MWKGQSLPAVLSVHSLLMVGWPREGKAVATEVQQQDETGLAQHVFPIWWPPSCHKVSVTILPVHFLWMCLKRRETALPHCSRETTEELGAHFGNTPMSFLEAGEVSAPLSHCLPKPYPLGGLERHRT